MIRKKLVTARFLGGGLALPVAVVMSITAAAPPAQADVSDTFTGFYEYVKNGYDIADKYILNNKPSDLAQMLAKID